MIYSYECQCGNVFDVNKKMEARNTPEPCGECHQMATRKQVPDSIQVCALAASDWQGSYFSQSLGRAVRSRSEERNLAKSRGLTEVGDADPKKTAKEFDKERKARADYDISEITNLGEVR